VHDRGPAATARVIVSSPAATNADIEIRAGDNCNLGFDQGPNTPSFPTSTSTASSGFHLDLRHPRRHGPFVLGIGIRGIEVETDLFVREGRGGGDDERRGDCPSNREPASHPRTVVRRTKPESHTTECERGSAGHQLLGLLAR